jgi:hypothetical protein
MSSITAKQSKLIAKQLGLPSDAVNVEDETSNARDYDAKQVAKAISSVMNFIISDAFNLNDEEHIWVGYHLSKIIKPLEFVKPTIILGAVKRELNFGEYSERLFQYKQNAEVQHAIPAAVRTAKLEDWTTVISAAILSSYPDARPMIQASVVGSVYGMLSELGISNDLTLSRQSTYLPTAVRFVLNAKR